MKYILDITDAKVKAAMDDLCIEPSQLLLK